MGLVGESGCGKTTLGRCLIRALNPTSGDVLFKSKENGTVNLTKLSHKQLLSLRKEIQLIFQDPYSSLDPRMTVYDIISEPAKYAAGLKGEELKRKVLDIAKKVSLDIRHLNRYPHAFSGGQRQRISIARALVTDPVFVVADEAVSALDVSVQAQILNLLQDLQSELNLTYLFITHDLSVIEHIADRITVMYLGQIIEMTATEELFQNPKHPYTEALLSAIPHADTEKNKKRIILEGDLPDPANLPSGCPFSPRCRYIKEICKTKRPELLETTPEHFVACHLSKRFKRRNLA